MDEGSSTPDLLERTIRALEEKLRELVSEREKLDRKIKDVQRSVLQWETQLKKLPSPMELLVTTITILRENLEYLGSDRKALLRKISETQNNLRKLASSANSNVEARLQPPASSLPPPEEVPNEASSGSELYYPPLDELPIKILELLEDENFDLPQLATIIEKDPEMAQHIQRVASSPLYGASQKFKDLTQAVVFLGLRNALSIALGFSLLKCMRKGHGNFEEQWCWRRLVINGISCRELARLTKSWPSEPAFLVGLTQDFGLLLLIQQRVGKYRKLLREHRREPRPLSVLEKELLRINHAKISETLLGGWNFPSENTEAVGHHHDEGLDISKCPPLLALLAVAEGISDFLLFPVMSTYRAMVSKIDALPKEEPIDLNEFLETIATESRDLGEILHVEFGGELEVEALIEKVLAQARQ